MTTLTTSAASPRLDALERGREHLLALQHDDGWWKGELETNVTIDAEDLFLRTYLGIPDARAFEATARWIRSKQREDGSWATFYGGPGDVSTTVEAYLALRLCGDRVDAAHMQSAAAFARQAGGIESTRVLTRMWLSLLGLWSWREVPVIPPEQILLPARAPLSIYSFGCWARQTIVALSVCCALRPQAPIEIGIDELRSGSARPAPAFPASRTFALLDRALRGYERLPARVLRRRALRAAERWIVERQERDGSWGGIQPPWVWSIVALHALGYELDHPVLAAALEGLDRFTIEDGEGRRIEACQSPCWDTAFALLALVEAGLDPDHEAVRRAGRWLVGTEVRVRGDWSIKRPELEPGGFPFEFANDNYPDVDDTALIVLALRRAGTDDGGAIERGVNWMVGMQSSTGGWAAFDVDNASRLPLKLPFSDFGAVTDPPSADVTAHVLEFLGLEGRAGEPAAQRGIEYLLREQEEDGSWFGRWGANYLYGTGAAVPALAACGLGDHPAVARAVAWLERVQNPDGGFGEDLRSYRDPTWRGRGPSTASQTAWGLLALHAAGSAGPALDRAVDWLVSTQRTDGGWDEPYFTGTGFPGDFYLNYHLYRDVFPVLALGRILGGNR